VLARSSIHLYSVIGLRNFPTRQVDFQCIFKIDLEKGMPLVESLVYAGNDSFHTGNNLLGDSIKITCTSLQGDLFQIKSDL